jgi:hypothetical protein
MMSAVTAIGRLVFSLAHAREVFTPSIFREKVMSKWWWGRRRPKLCTILEEEIMV